MVFSNAGGGGGALLRDALREGEGEPDAGVLLSLALASLLVLAVLSKLSVLALKSAAAPSPSAPSGSSAWLAEVSSKFVVPLALVLPERAEQTSASRTEGADAR